MLTILLMPKKSKNGSKKGGPKKSSQLRFRNEADGESYAEVLRPLGNDQFMVQIFMKIQLINYQI